MIVNNQINVQTAQLFLESLTQLRNLLPGIIDFLNNSIFNQEIARSFASSLRDVVLPMIEKVINTIIEFITRNR